MIRRCEPFDGCKKRCEIFTESLKKSFAPAPGNTTKSHGFFTVRCLIRNPLSPRAIMPQSSIQTIHVRRIAYRGLLWHKARARGASDCGCCFAGFGGRHFELHADGRQIKDGGIAVV